VRERIRSSRAAALGAVGVLLVALALVFSVAAGGKNHSYIVRAIFDDAGNVISGEEVKIAGADVGTVGAVTPTPQQKAAVELKIENEGFQNFRQDASCIIRPQALIGEKYVDCLPTQPRPEGTPLPPPLKKIPEGHEGEGQYLLPVTNTHSPVDVDLLGDLQRLPERERFTIILNELGVGLAERGSDLNAVIRRANPALQELDRVLQILASQNKVLTKLAVDSNKALAPWAGVRDQFANFIAESAKVSQASANQSKALEENLALFPRFLEELGPAMDRLGHFADETTGAFRPLLTAAPSISKLFEQTPAFSAASEKYTVDLGKAGKETGPALVATLPLLDQLEKLGRAGLPTATNLAGLLTSLRGTGGLERIMDFIFLGAGTANGYDKLGHFLRSEGVGTACLKVELTEKVGCGRKLFNEGRPPTGTSASTASAHETSSALARTLADIDGRPAVGGPGSAGSADGPLLNYLLGR